MNGFVKAGRPFGRIRDTLTDGRAAGPLLTGRHGQGAGDGADEAKRLAPMRISPRGGQLMQRAVRLGELSAPWAIACALPQREGHAEAELARAGFEAYCPREIALPAMGALTAARGGAPALPALYLLQGLSRPWRGARLRLAPLHPAAWRRHMGERGARACRGTRGGGKRGRSPRRRQGKAEAAGCLSG